MFKTVLLTLGFCVWWFIFFYMFAEYPTIFQYGSGA